MRPQLNADFEPGACRLTRYNAAACALPLLSTTEQDGGAPPLAERVEQVNPYANTCGVIALPRRDEATLGRYGDAISRAASVRPPEYD